MDHQLIKQIFIGLILVVAIVCIIYQSLDFCGCHERCCNRANRTNRTNRRIDVKQAPGIP